MFLWREYGLLWKSGPEFNPWHGLDHHRKELVLDWQSFTLSTLQPLRSQQSAYDQTYTGVQNTRPYQESLNLLFHNQSLFQPVTSINIHPCKLTEPISIQFCLVYFVSFSLISGGGQPTNIHSPFDNHTLFNINQEEIRISHYPLRGPTLLPLLQFTA